MNITLNNSFAKVEAERMDGNDWLFVDLARSDDTPGQHEPAGPRIAIRRTDDRLGWRIIMHEDGGDESLIVEITDGSRTLPPYVDVQHNVLGEGR